MSDKRQDDDPGSSRLSNQVRESVEAYFSELNGETPCDVYRMVLNEVEKPLLEMVMHYASQNQSRASRILGINRNTLRKKLEAHQII